VAFSDFTTVSDRLGVFFPARIIYLTFVDAFEELQHALNLTSSFH